MNKKFSTITWFLIIWMLYLITVVAIGVFFYFETKNMGLVYAVSAIVLVSLLCGYFIYKTLHKAVEDFTKDMCVMMDNLLNETEENIDIQYSEELYSKVQFRLVRIDEILKEERKLLAKEKKLLQEYISDTAHQIKTPMANLKMISEMLLYQTLSPQEKQSFLQSSNEQLNKLEFVLNALIKSSRLETNMVVLSKKQYDVQEIVSEAITLSLPLLTKKAQETTFTCVEDLQVFADKKWLIECVFNILENAIKYTKAKGEINIDVVKKEMYTVITITDNGCGIKETEYGSIFKRFYRGEESGDTEGVGIGLYLAREIITLHNGYINVNSTVGIGSAFEIHLLNTDR